MQREVSQRRPQPGQDDARVPGASSTRRRKRGYPGDKLYVPTDQLDLLTRYVGGEAPALSKMGGSDWSAAKGKARKAVRDIAVELVKLYSRAHGEQGPRLPARTPRGSASSRRRSRSPRPPTSCTTIDEVKADMERPIPMDRLLSGDVGYGKTEIAVRAAFKAVQDGKQVAMLVPTTLLVRQHMETFAERFAGFPVHLRALSRFQTDKESKETIAGLARRHGRRRHRHPPAAQPRSIVVQRPRARHHRRGAALRRRAQGRAEEAEDQRRHPGDERDADPAHARDGGHRHPRDVDAGDAAGGPASDPHLRRPVQRQAGRRPRSAASCCARARCSSCTTGCRRSTGSRRSSPSSCRRRASPSRTASCRERVLEQVMVDFWERKFDVLVSHHDHRDRPRHRQREHAHHRPRRQVRARRSCTRSAAGSGVGASARTRTSSTTTTSRSARPRTTGSRRSPRTTSSAAACRSR